MSELVTLPSGTIVDLVRPNIPSLKTVDDVTELKYMLSEKIIDIELQLDLHESGLKPEAPPDWAPRARASLKWTKLYRDECQTRQGRLNDRQRQERHAALDRCAVEIVKALISQDHFDAIVSAAKALGEARVASIDAPAAKALVRT